MESELEFEEFFQSSLGTEREDADEDVSDVSDLSGLFQLSSDQEKSEKAAADAGWSSDIDEYQKDDLDSADSDSFQHSGCLSDIEELSEERMKSQRHPLSLSTDDSLHISAIILEDAAENTPDAGREESTIVFSGFKTGSNKKIEVKEESIRSAYRMFGTGPGKTKNGDSYRSEAPLQSMGLKKQKNASQIDLENVRANVRKRFSREDESWFSIQFKWSWIHHALAKKALDEESLVDKIEEQMWIRKKSEYSVLRRIVEGDDVSWRYMIVLVIGVTEEHLEIFDGFYSLFARYDGLIEKKVRRKEVHVGCKLKVFGADLLIKEPTSIFDVAGVSLMLHYNGVQVIYSRRRLGYRKKIVFRTGISSISREGGCVGCIEGTVVEILETKYSVRLENYSYIADDLETELEKIERLAKDANRSFVSEDLKISMYTRFLVRDDSGECVVTWWSPSDEIKAGRTIRMIYLLPSTKHRDLHLKTTKNTTVRLL
ncbi:integral membrane protein [Biomphalaria pfeifferi]|uniref:Integral membrane protein n=1 Tax=Biomphalaria pfeifferi TaxID=112525 RepID=A0AAD8AMT0_BIOPF|nr:integral membrane protein [Biomphalaria pfeifferi]